MFIKLKNFLYLKIQGISKIKHMRIKTLLNLTLSTLCILFAACKEELGTDPFFEINYSEQHKYYPLQDGNKWVYELVIVDSSKGSTETLTETGIHSEDSLRTNFYRYGNFWSYAFLENNGLGLFGPNNMILVNYGKLSNCTGDSMAIYFYQSGHTNMHIYQYCGEQFASDVDAYKTLKCIKTRQTNYYFSVLNLEIIRYYAYNVGLVYEVQNTYNQNGKLVKHITKRLKSHTF